MATSTHLVLSSWRSMAASTEKQRVKREQTAFFLLEAKRTEAKDAEAAKYFVDKELGEAWKALSDEEREPYVTKAAAVKALNQSKDYSKKGGVRPNIDLTTCVLLVLTLSSDSLLPLLKAPELLLLRHTSHEVHILVNAADTWSKILAS